MSDKVTGVYIYRTGYSHNVALGNKHGALHHSSHSTYEDAEAKAKELVKLHKPKRPKKDNKVTWHGWKRIDEDVPTNSTSVNVAGTTNDATWKKVKSALWNRKKKMKTFKEFVEITEAAKYENFDETSSAHRIVRDLNKSHNARKKLATYHKDGSATFHAHGAWHPYHSYHSYNVVDSVMKHAGGNFNHSPEVYDNHTQTLGGHVYHSKKLNNYQHDIHVKKV